LHKTTIIAAAGKGGVGKTSICAAMVRLLAERYPESRILAIDADPAVGLAAGLGVEAESTLDDIRKRIVASVERGEPKEAVELLGEARFQIFDTMVEQEGFSFLAIGRPESAGCYCKVNAYLKEVISLLAKDFDYVVIDGEAGIEQINRRVMEEVTHLVLVTDSSRKGVQVAKTIQKVAKELVMYRQCGAIVNRVSDPSMLALVDLSPVEMLVSIPADEEHAANEVRGLSVFELSDGAPLLQGVKKALERWKIL
jgi:CO dehydrogenase maturation factor